MTSLTHIVRPFPTQQLRHLVNEGVVQDYPPLCDIPG